MIRAMLFCTISLPLLAQSDRAYSLLTDLATANRTSFFLYKDQDSGANKVYPSGIFPSDTKLKLDPACVDEPGDRVTGCSQDRRKLDCLRGNVLRLTWSPMSATEFFGVNFEEPENFGSRARGDGYNLQPATDLVLRYRSPTGISVQFGLNDGRNAFATGFINVPASATWVEGRFKIADLRVDNNPDLRPILTNVHVPFYVVTNGGNAPSGGTLLLDDIRLEPVPANQTAVTAFPLANLTCGVIPAPDQSTGRVAIPPDQVNRNLSTTYENAMALWAFLRRGTAPDLTNARAIADAMLYALSRDNSGFPLPKAPDGAAGLRNAYIDGDLPFLNDQRCPGSVRCPPASAGTGTDPCLARPKNTDPCLAPTHAWCLAPTHAWHRPTPHRPMPGTT